MSAVQIRFDLQRDLHLLAQRHTAPRNRPVVADAEVGAVDLGRRGETALGPALRIRAELGRLDLESHRLRHAPDGELTVDEEIAVVVADPGGAEGQCGVVLCVEEVRGADVIIAHLVVGVDRAGLDRDRDDRVQRVGGGNDLTAE